MPLTRIDPTVKLTLPLDKTYTWEVIKKAYPNHHVVVNNCIPNDITIKTCTLLAVFTSQYAYDISK